MTANERIGRNIRAQRYEREHTQAELATFMRRAGFKWSQATVRAIEKGERPLRLAEAVDLGEILQTPLDVLATGDLS